MVAKIDNVGGGVKLLDVNPNRDMTNLSSIFGTAYYLAEGSENKYGSLVVCGYKKISFGTQTSQSSWLSTCGMTFVYDDGTLSSEIKLSSSTNPYTSNGWKFSDWIDIPSNVVGVLFTTKWNGSLRYMSYCYSLLA